MFASFVGAFLWYSHLAPNLQRKPERLRFEERHHILKCILSFLRGALLGMHLYFSALSFHSHCLGWFPMNKGGWMIERKITYLLTMAGVMGSKVRASSPPPTCEVFQFGVTSGFPICKRITFKRYFAVAHNSSLVLAENGTRRVQV